MVKSDQNSPVKSDQIVRPNQMKTVKSDQNSQI